MTENRWVLNRAGVLNFWFYSDEVFELSEGRLIFRGANGSGKSVTMQSFLPLVLDGDKRPSRLDPFGSRDRKIEYYLLGETESGIQDRTGYLYLEFRQPESNRFLTVGIGLRARRGAAQVGFWGFAITDRRRIGKDLFLYDRDLFEKHGQKVPLDRAELEQLIGEGGKVVREQGEYCQMVNQLLFGFADLEAYKDLLELMIQLRSPKLSKDFKPSTIYGILNDALPPLSDEDLRPLAEVIEDMDEIGDRLDELRMHRTEAEKLVQAYDQYNGMRLFELSAKVLQDETERKQKATEVLEQEQIWNGLQEEEQQTLSLLDASKQELLQTETEIDHLNRSEAMEKQQELKTAQDRLAETQEEVRRTNERIDDLEQDRQKKEERAEKVKADLAKYLDEQRELRNEMDALAREIEFQDHDLYERQWANDGQPADEKMWAGWKRDVAGYRQELKDTYELCVYERELAAKASEAEQSMSAARESRDTAERLMHTKEEALRQAIVRQEDSLLAWHKGLQRLHVAEETFRTVLHRLQRYPELAYDEIVEPFKSAAEQALAEITAQRLTAEHQLNLQVQLMEQLRGELQAWRDHREPEPEHSEARSRSRKRRMESETQPGGPLYTLCEFRPHVDERTKAVLETVLHRSGLLDAWISPDAVEVLEQEEEVWIKPSPVWFGHTLADYLEPTPSAESGLTAQQVEEVLRTIQIGQGDGSGGQRDGSAAFITETGQFVLGPLTGQTVGKERPEWIGAEARKQARLAEIKRLEEQVQAVEQEIDKIRGQIRQLQEESEHIRQELAALPADEDLRAASRILHDAKADWEHAQKVETECSGKYKEAARKWRDQQRTVLEKTAKWSRLKKEKDFREALDTLQDYERQGLSLKATLAVLGRIRQEARRLEEELQAAADRIASEQEHLDVLSTRETQFSAAVQSLTKLVQELGVYDVFQRLQELQEHRSGLNKTIDRCNTELRRLDGELGAAKERLWQKRTELEQSEQLLQKSLTDWQYEWKLGLVEFEPEHPLRTAVTDTPEGVLKTAQAIRNLFRARYEPRRKEQMLNQLQETFVLAKNALLDYSLVQRYEETGERIFIESLRDRTQPWTPRMLLNELLRMEEEQRLLIEEKDRELYEQILIHSVGRAIKDKINRAEQWVREMNRFMENRKTSSGLVLSLEWTPRAARNEREMDTEKLVRLLRKNPNTLLPEETEQMVEHFRSRIRWAKEDAAEGEGLRKWMQELLDYRNWFAFTLYFRKGSQPWRELTDSRFNVMSGGEKAMAMYIPLFAATDSRYKDSRSDAPRIITLDEAFAGVDDENMRDMFQLLTDMRFDYMMTSQVLWGCYDTVPSLSIYEVYRPQDVDFVTLIPYYWNGVQRRMMEDGDWEAVKEVAAARFEG
ncbi:TIGR02680 family protein [Effusibacillus dendaii]|uniref:TIGR02680 family protein n=1 Tax=Effusibacillus dendaii TaxID=2743772 RepID=A0A7I8D9M0_9BACL|nr:TIGR02680 family protein [Effusibacillus dendaii]BCJ86804.1 TIGR02680 family protein [Effusibacillus dendaii]